ncbi:MAG: hypothetical protein JNN11_03125 [Candidatus Doudnabacteria bacterium]|nr:hypothetical protein [Candidatus Doudnabacteria bacterium]
MKKIFVILVLVFLCASCQQSSEKPGVVSEDVPLKLVSPKSGEVWQAGAQYQVRWEGEAGDVKGYLVPLDSIKSDGSYTGLLETKAEQGKREINFNIPLAPLYDGEFKILLVLGEGREIWGGEVRVSLSKSPNPYLWKGERAPKFEDFPATVYSGPRGEVKIPDSVEVLAHVLEIEEVSKGKPNFSGSYAIVNWGCGTSCLDGALINLKDGSVSMPEALVSQRGNFFRATSSLYVSDPNTNLEYNSAASPLATLPVKYYVLRDGRFHLIYWEKCELIAGRQVCK